MEKIKRGLAIVSSALALSLLNPSGKNADAVNPEADNASRTTTFVGEYGRPETRRVDFELSVSNGKNLIFARSLSGGNNGSRKDVKMDPTNEFLCVSHPKEIGINYETIAQTALIEPRSEFENLTPFEYDADSQFWIGNARNLINDIHAKSPTVVKSMMAFFTNYLTNKNKERMYHMRRSTNLEYAVECMPMFVPKKIALKTGWETFRTTTIPLNISNLTESKKVYVISDAIVKKVWDNQVRVLDEVVLSRMIQPERGSQRTRIVRTEIASPSEENSEFVSEINYGNQTPKIFQDFVECSLNEIIKYGLKKYPSSRIDFFCPEYLVKNISQTFSKLEETADPFKWNEWAGVLLSSPAYPLVNEELSLIIRNPDASQRINGGKIFAERISRGVILRKVNPPQNSAFKKYQNAFGRGTEFYLADNSESGLRSSFRKQVYFALVPTSQGKKILPKIIEF